MAGKPSFPFIDSRVETASLKELREMSAQDFESLAKRDGIIIVSDTGDDPSFVVVPIGTYYRMQKLLTDISNVT